jgi:hypothetical protein
MSGASRKPVLVVPPVAAGGFNLRRPLRITITVSWSVYQALVTSSDQQGRSLSNLAAYWLERQAESPGISPEALGSGAAQIGRPQQPLL